MHLAAANEPDLSDPRLRSGLRRNGLPVPGRPEDPWIKRFLTSPMTWVIFATLVIEAICIVRMWFELVPDKKVPGGSVVGIGEDTVWLTLPYALITVIPLTLLFLWADRYRPQRFWVWLVTFGWGACVATYLSLHVNTWAAAQLSVAGDGDPATAPRAAVFVAPFVEEATKATILFFLAIAMRYRWVSTLSGITLAGLSASAFAFTENIIYYTRSVRLAYKYGVDESLLLQSTFFQRGVLTFFGHPLFTAMTGIGLAIALRTRSKLVRVLAPVTGFLAAALLHMLFNGVASAGLPEQALLIPLVFVAYPMVITLIVFTVRQFLAQRRLIGARLADYARMGWLNDTDVEYAPRPLTRIRVLWQALWGGRLLSTWMMQRALTELAYLRDSIARGLVDDAGLVREKQLLFRIRGLRERAIVAPLPRTVYPWQRRRRKAQLWSAPSYPGPAGLGGNYPAPVPAAPGGVPLGSRATQYSAVDPRWKPPTP
ncbi:PrsW family intramembrane metalloprotease [Naumannella sp. ID2617S]|nr:PrsW family intramembrane metalloprotease [Naumannella sp. ID2617S]